MHVTAIIVAAGEGKRLGGQVSKSFLPIAGRPLVLRTLDRFFSTQSIEKVILVVADERASTEPSVDSKRPKSQPSAVGSTSRRRHPTGIG